HSFPTRRSSDLHSFFTPPAAPANQKAQCTLNRTSFTRTKLIVAKCCVCAKAIACSHRHVCHLHTASATRSRFRYSAASRQFWVARSQRLRSLRAFFRIIDRQFSSACRWSFACCSSITELLGRSTRRVCACASQRVKLCPRSLVNSGRKLSAWKFWTAS